MDFLIHHMLSTSAGRYPDKEALVDAKQRLGYTETVKPCGAIASGLRAVGMKHGDRVGIWLESSLLQAISILGASQSGGVFVPINSQAAHIMRDCGTVGLITTKDKIA
jgi:acyl-CoA synthetase (AMP-forming)/AMP-acid ligase II